MSISTPFIKLNPHRRRTGLAMIYGIFIVMAMAAFCSLAVDLGRTQLVKTELLRASDAAARFGAMGLENGTASARANAIAAASANNADGSSVVLISSDVEIGSWDSSTKTFTSLEGTANVSSSNAVRVTARRVASRGTAIPMTFGKVIGINSCDVTASAVCTYASGASISTTVPATSNPHLAGMPSGSVASLNNPHNNPDYAPAASPPQVVGLSLSAGTALTFDSINGGATNQVGQTMVSADGGTPTTIVNGAENGISDVNAPFNCLIGVFLDNSQPNLSSPPSALDFGSTASQNFTALSPQLKQIFFIGDGRASDGTVQQFIVPAGATRFYLATMDSYEWNNNGGSYTTTVHRLGTVSTVK